MGLLHAIAISEQKHHVKISKAFLMVWLQLIESAQESIIDDTFDSDAMYEWYGEKLPLNQYLSNVVGSALTIQNDTASKTALLEPKAEDSTFK